MVALGHSPCCLPRAADPLYISSAVLQVITCADFHPYHCSVFAYSSSKGCIRLGDMRSSALCDTHAKLYEEVDPVRGFGGVRNSILGSTS